MGTDSGRKTSNAEIPPSLMPRRCSTTSLTDLFRAVLSTMLYWAKRLFEIIISLFICKFYLIRNLKREKQSKGTDFF